MLRGRSAGHKGVLVNLFTGFHLSLELTEPDELTEASVVARLRQCGGAHAPTSFEF
jgi:hypothetical protein